MTDAFSRTRDDAGSDEADVAAFEALFTEFLQSEQGQQVLQKAIEVAERKKKEASGENFTWTITLYLYGLGRCVFESSPLIICRRVWGK